MDSEMDPTTQNEAPPDSALDDEDAAVLRELCPDDGPLMPSHMHPPSDGFDTGLNLPGLPDAHHHPNGTDSFFFPPLDDPFAGGMDFGNVPSGADPTMAAGGEVAADHTQHSTIWQSHNFQALEEDEDLDRMLFEMAAVSPSVDPSPTARYARGASAAGSSSRDEADDEGGSRRDQLSIRPIPKKKRKPTGTTPTPAGRVATGVSVSPQPAAVKPTPPPPPPPPPLPQGTAAMSQQAQVASSSAAASSAPEQPEAPSQPQQQPPPQPYPSPPDRPNDRDRDLREPMRSSGSRERFCDRRDDRPPFRDRDRDRGRDRGRDRQRFSPRGRDRRWSERDARSRRSRSRDRDLRDREWVRDRDRSRDRDRERERDRPPRERDRERERHGRHGVVRDRDGSREEPRWSPVDNDTGAAICEMMSADEMQRALQSVFQQSMAVKQQGGGQQPTAVGGGEGAAAESLPFGLGFIEELRLSRADLTRFLQLPVVTARQCTTGALARVVSGPPKPGTNVNTFEIAEITGLAESPPYRVDESTVAFFIEIRVNDSTQPVRITQVSNQPFLESELRGWVTALSAKAVSAGLPTDAFLLAVKEGLQQKSTDLQTAKRLLASDSGTGGGQSSSAVIGAGSSEGSVTGSPGRGALAAGVSLKAKSKAKQRKSKTVTVPPGHQAVYKLSDEVQAILGIEGGILDVILKRFRDHCQSKNLMMPGHPNVVLCGADEQLEQLFHCHSLKIGDVQHHLKAHLVVCGSVPIEDDQNGADKAPSADTPSAAAAAAATKEAPSAIPALAPEADAPLAPAHTPQDDKNGEAAQQDAPNSHQRQLERLPSQKSDDITMGFGADDGAYGGGMVDMATSPTKAAVSKRDGSPDKAKAATADESKREDDTSKSSLLPKPPDPPTDRAPKEVLDGQLMEMYMLMTSGKIPPLVADEMLGIEAATATAGGAATADGPDTGATTGNGSGAPADNGKKDKEGGASRRRKRQWTDGPAAPQPSASQPSPIPTVIGATQPPPPPSPLATSVGLDPSLPLNVPPELATALLTLVTQGAQANVQPPMPPPAPSISHTPPAVPGPYHHPPNEALLRFEPQRRGVEPHMDAGGGYPPLREAIMESRYPRPHDDSLMHGGPPPPPSLTFRPGRGRVWSPRMRPPPPPPPDDMRGPGMHSPPMRDGREYPRGPRPAPWHEGPTPAPWHEGPKGESPIDRPWRPPQQRGWDLPGRSVPPPPPPPPPDSHDNHSSGSPSRPAPNPAMIPGLGLAQAVPVSGGGAEGGGEGEGAARLEGHTMMVLDEHT
ncbi:unnamed protein product [Vitrella brassicaformis CCMP3155]|uniref:Plus3 domain-containing protein n=5 Tax=Vitrella brassicaformis TaxID=1169539 RepID=A0A0G4FA74_VITBC|nr:unnamed protein product [Vitrella brassicaformis CCMP3155]|eukprot:CEM09781.1 unnamed protein product [Vitrella brassicaformis CCMP3155]